MKSIVYIDDVSYYKDQSTIYYYDYNSNKSSPICSKSGCTHNNHDCDFYQVIKFIESDDYIYYLRDEGFYNYEGSTRLKQSICKYDKVDKNVVTILTIYASKDDSINFHMELNEFYLYFYRGYTIDSSHKSCTLYRLNLKNRIVEKMFESDRVHSFIYNGRLIYNDNNDGIYSTGLYGDDKRYIIKDIDNLYMIKSGYPSEYIYFNIKTDNGLFDLYRVSIRDGKVEFIAENVPESLYYGVVITNEKVYYCNTNVNKCSIIHTCQLNGSNNQEIYKINSEIISMAKMDNYIAIIYRESDQTKKGILYEETTASFVN